MIDLYPLGECPDPYDWNNLDKMLDKSGINCRNIMSWYKPLGNNVVGIMAVKTGEMRPPKAGEWYICGTTPHAWKAKEDYQTAYEIAKLVTTRTKTKTKITEIPKDD